MFNQLESSILYRLQGFCIRVYENGIIRLYEEQFLQDNRNSDLIFILEAHSEEEIRDYINTVFDPNLTILP